jgi:CubicO group peptidase (beta-lactamase class C family)
MLRRPLLVLTLLLLASTAPAGSFASPNAFDLDATVARAMQAYNVPGIAVAVVKDGKVVMAKGYGVRQLGAAPTVDADTLFGIASNTKAFTTAALALLVDDGKLNWDDPVVKYLPSFAMHDAWVTKEMTIRDLVTHRSGLGLGEGDLLWWPHTDYSRDEIVRRIRFLPPATSFRSGYAYDNVLYLVAGQVVAAASGKSWDDYVRERILGTLAMTSTKTSISLIPAGANVARPHVVADGELRSIASLPIDNMAPCCGILSSANDMGKWMLALLDRRVVSEKQSRELFTPQTVQPPEFPKPLLQSYALGWSVRDYRGQLVATHTGGLLGMTSRVLLVPEARLGVTVMTNQDEHAAFDAIAWSVVDFYLGGPPVDWFGALKVSQKPLAPERAADAKPSLPLTAYAGRYRDSWYGDATVALEKAKLVLRFAHTPALTGDLEPQGGEKFLALWRDRSLNADAMVTFTDGHMRLDRLSPLTDFSFDFDDLDFVTIHGTGGQQ